MGIMTLECLTFSSFTDVSIDAQADAVRYLRAKSEDVISLAKRRMKERNEQTTTQTEGKE